VIGRIAELSKKVKVGDPLDPTTQVGAIITPQHLAKIEGYVTAAAQAMRHRIAWRRHARSRHGPVHGADHPV
jgi:acyl-CoA reductase-like NAD-dependent aldehyde dehydrogenase